MMKNIVILTEAPGVKKRNRTHLATRKNYTQGKATAKLLLHLKRGNGVAAIHTKGKGETSSGPEAAADAEAKVPIMIMTFGAATKNSVHGITLVALIRAWPVNIMTVGAATLVALLRAWPVNIMTVGAATKNNVHGITLVALLRVSLLDASLAADTSLLDVSLLDIGLRRRPDIDVVLLPMPRAASQGGEGDNQAVGPPQPDQSADIGAMTTLLAARCGCQPTNEAASFMSIKSTFGPGLCEAACCAWCASPDL